MPRSRKGRRENEGPVPKYADVLRNHPPKVFWENPRVIRLVMMAMFEKSRSLGEVCLVLGVTPEMIFAKVAKDKDQQFTLKKSRPGEVVRTSRRLQIKKQHRLNFVSYPEFLERKMGSKKEFWDQPFVESKLVEVTRNQSSIGRASELLGVTKSMMHYHLVKKGLFTPTSKGDNIFTKQYEKHIVKEKIKKKVVKVDQELNSTVRSKTSEDSREEISLYESIRLRNIEEKKAMLRQLGFCSEGTADVKSRRSLSKKRELPAPRDKSLRIKEKERRTTTDVAVPDGEFQIPPVPQMNLEDFLTVRQDFRKSFETLGEAKRLVNSLNEQNNNLSDVLEHPDHVSIKCLGWMTKGEIVTLDVYPETHVTLAGAGDVGGEVGVWLGDETGHCVSLKPHSKSVNCLQFNPWNPPQTLTSGDDGFLRALDLSSQKLEIVYQWDKFPTRHQEKGIGWHSVTSPNQLLLCHKPRGNIYRFDARSGTRSYFLTGNGSKISIDLNNPSIMAVPSGRKVVVVDERFLKTNVGEIPTWDEVKSAHFSKDSTKLLVSIVSGEKSFVQVHDLKTNRLKWENGEAKICPNFEQGAVWHPDEENIVFFPICRNRNRREIGETSASLIAVNAENGKIVRNFAEFFTEKNFGIVTSRTNPRIYFPNACGRGSVSLMSNLC